MSSETRPVPAESYTEAYFLESCGGAEFFKLYGPKVVKPSQVHALKSAALEPGMEALDVGCGRGEILYQLRERRVKAVGADYALAALALAAETAKAPVLRCDAKSLPFRNGSFDRIFFLGVLDHLHDWELEAGFAEFARVLKPGGFVLASTCTNTEYHKSLTYAARRTLARALGLKDPSPPRTDEDAVLHVNEHALGDLERFFSRIGWQADIEPRPNEKYSVFELYGKPLPERFPLKPAPPWKTWFMQFAFQGPLKRLFAREFFCRLSPPSDQRPNI